MNLVVDIGNTLVKLAVFDRGEIVFQRCVERLHPSMLEELFAAWPVRRAVVASTRGDVDGAKRANNYSTLLGPPIIISHKERAKANVVGKMTAIGDVEGRNVLIVDFGTAVTIDLVTADATFRGGCISPGMKTRFRALHDYTAKLPLCAATESEELAGLTTRQAIELGVMNGIAFEIEGYAARMRSQIEDLCVIFTGGDANFFVKRIKNTIFANCNLVFCGLNRILEYNASEEHLN